MILEMFTFLILIPFLPPPEPLIRMFLSVRIRLHGFKYCPLCQAAIPVNDGHPRCLFVLERLIPLTDTHCARLLLGESCCQSSSSCQYITSQWFFQSRTSFCWLICFAAVIFFKQPGAMAWSHLKFSLALG